MVAVTFIWFVSSALSTTHCCWNSYTPGSVLMTMPGLWIGAKTFDVACTPERLGCMRVSEDEEGGKVKTLSE